MTPFSVTPIGIVHTPFPDRVSTPRQPHAAKGVAGTIELLPGNDFEHALEDLEGWDYIWLIFLFHLNTTWRPKVLPPRSSKRRGVFSTRSPHRPNPIGLSVVRLLRVEGLTLHIEDVDLIDGTPLLDIKPYVPYCDAHPQARTGWLEAEAVTGEAPPDPKPAYYVTWSDLAQTQTRWLMDTHGVDLIVPAERTLALGPEPHPYRRIRAEVGGVFRLAVKDWRVRFRVEEKNVVVIEIRSGYRPSELATSSEPAVAIQRAFVAQFGESDEIARG